MWEKIEASAPGKVILHGEHAVVYGKAAIAVSLGLKTQVTLVPNQSDTISLKFENLNMQINWSSQDFKEVLSEIKDVDDHMQPSAYMDKISKLLKKRSDCDKNLSTFQKLATTIFLFLFLAIYKKYQKNFVPIDINVSTQLSLGAGMGSSASYAVCLAAAFLSSIGEIANNLNEDDIKKISDWAFGAETIAHGQPSGIDNSICSYGGALLFKDRKISCTLSNAPQLKILLVDTGVERNTSQLVANMKQKFNSHPTVIACIMDAIDAISSETWSLLGDMHLVQEVSEKFHLLQELVKMNQYLLNCLNVSHPKLDEICHIAESFGYVAKLTGAGGGGCAFIVLPFHSGEGDSNIEKLKITLSSKNLKFWDVSLGGSGVTVDKI